MLQTHIHLKHCAVAMGFIGITQAVFMQWLSLISFFFFEKIWLWLLASCWLSKFSSYFIVLQGSFTGDHLNDHHLGKTDTRTEVSIIHHVQW